MSTQSSSIKECLIDKEYVTSTQMHLCRGKVLILSRLAGLALSFPRIEFRFPKTNRGRRYFNKLVALHVPDGFL